MQIMIASISKVCGFNIQYVAVCVYCMYLYFLLQLQMSFIPKMFLQDCLVTGATFEDITLNTKINTKHWFDVCLYQRNTGPFDFHTLTSSTNLNWI